MCFYGFSGEKVGKCIDRGASRQTRAAGRRRRGGGANRRRREPAPAGVLGETVARLYNASLRAGRMPAVSPVSFVGGDAPPGLDATVPPDNRGPWTALVGRGMLVGLVSNTFGR